MITLEIRTCHGWVTACIFEDLHVDVPNTKVILEPWTYWHFVKRFCVALERQREVTFPTWRCFHVLSVRYVCQEAVLAKVTFPEKMQHLRPDS